VALVATFLVGCGNGDEQGEGQGPAASSLVTEPVEELWDVSAFPMPVCFRNGFNGNTTDATAADRDAVRQRVEQTWEGVPRSAVDFTGFDVCPADDSTFLKLFMSSTSTGNTPFDGTLGHVVRITLGNTDQDVYTTIHEFGHVLGLRHEQLHPDKPPSCTKTDSNDGPLQASSAILSDYDPDAVMNYCATPNPTTITAREALFTEMAYPSNTLNHPIHAPNAYIVRNGLLVQVGTELQTDWTHRGAAPAAFEWVDWHYSGFVSRSVTLPALNGSFDYDHDFVDFRGQSHTGLSQNVTADDAAFAALTMAILG
jgi:hypothetical protein